MSGEESIANEDKIFARDQLMEYVLRLYEEASVHSGWTTPPDHIDKIMDIIWNKATALGQIDEEPASLSARITAPDDHTRAASGQ